MSAGVALGLLLSVVGSPELDALWPCEPGLSITYRAERDGKDTKIRIIETVRGPKAPRLCHIDRVTRRPGEADVADAYVLERLDDRISYAGFADAPTAFRPPLLKLPIRPGASWTFNRVGYRIEGVGTVVEVPAGRFEGCVRVVEAALKEHAHAGWVIYAPNIGPIVKVTQGTRLVAEKILRPTKAVAPRRR